MIHRSPFYSEPSTRQVVYEYDGYRCRHCGTGERLTLDHIWPRVLGGRDTFENLQTLCSPCNTRKGCWPFMPPVAEKKPKVKHVPLIPDGWRKDGTKRHRIEYRERREKRIKPVLGGPSRERLRLKVLLPIGNGVHVASTI